MRDKKFFDQKKSTTDKKMSRIMMEQSIKMQVEFEDLDAGGVVFHANYIRICDRARNRWFFQYGIEFNDLKKRDIALAVRSIKADFLRPVLLEEIIVKMTLISKSEKSVTVVHEILTKSSSFERVYFRGEIVLVAMNYSTGKSCALPEEINNMLKES